MLRICFSASVLFGFVFSNVLIRRIFLSTLICLFSPDVFAQFDMILTSPGSVRIGDTNSVSLPTGATSITAQVLIAPTPGIVSENRVVGWSTVFVVEGALEITDVTTSDTRADCASHWGPGLRCCSDLFTGFEQTEIAFPENNNGQYGAFSAVVLCFAELVTLDPSREEFVLNIGLNIESPVPPSGLIGRLRFQDGLRGSGSSVSNVLTLAPGGNTIPPTRTIGLDIWPTPLPPNQFSAQLRAEQSIGLAWEHDSTDILNFIIERTITPLDDNGQGGGASGETYVFQTSGDKRAYIDAVVPPNSEVKYSISAKNANSTSESRNSQKIITPNSRWQLKIYDSAQDNWVDLKNPSQFNPEYGTAVIVHGWQSLLGASNPITGWVEQMAQAIHSRLNRIDKQANIMAWEWIPEATSLLPNTAATKADDQVQKLKSSLSDIFPRDYTGPIHFMGHSLGSHIVTFVSMFLSFDHPAFKDTFPPSQITLWDTPDTGIGIGNLDINCNYLRSKGVYIDSYAGCTNLLSHNAHFRVDVPCIDLVACGYGICHSKPHEWYRETVEGNILHLKKSTTCRDPDWEVNIGFNASILLSANPQNPDDLQRPAIEGCNQEGTLEFSKLSICSLQVPGDAFGLDNLLECPTPKLPLQEHTQDVTRGNFWTDEFYQCNCSYANSTEAIIGIGRRGQGGGAQVEFERLTARYTLNFVVNPQWDYISFEYDFTSAPAPADLEVTLISQESSYPLFSINSDTVFNGAYLVSGLRNIREFHNQSITLQIDLASTQSDAFVNIRNITFWKDPYNGNQPPVADAGEDQVFTVNCHELVSVTLDGTSSYDPDSDNLEFRWFNRGELLAIGQEQALELLSGDYTIALVIRDGANNTATDEMKITISAQCSFIRGDSNIDGTVDISDAVNTLGYLFTGQGNALCKDASDANDSGDIDISDAIFTLGFLFLGTKTPPPPYPEPGIGETNDNLDCREYPL